MTADLEEVQVKHVRKSVGRAAMQLVQHFVS